MGQIVLFSSRVSLHRGIRDIDMKGFVGIVAVKSYSLQFQHMIHKYLKKSVMHILWKI